MITVPLTWKQFISNFRKYQFPWASVSSALPDTEQLQQSGKESSSSTGNEVTSSTGKESEPVVATNVVNKPELSKVQVKIPLTTDAQNFIGTVDHEMFFRSTHEHTNIYSNCVYGNVLDKNT